MVPKSGRQVRLRKTLTDADLAVALGSALTEELGGSRRATKSVMSWTGVSDHTARSWLHGRSCPGGRHLLLLSAHSEAVMRCFLRLSGHESIGVGLDLASAEAMLTQMLDAVRQLRERR